MIEELNIKDPQSLIDEVMAVDWGNIEVLGDILSPIFSKLYRSYLDDSPVTNTQRIETMSEEDSNDDFTQQTPTEDNKSREIKETDPKAGDVGSLHRYNRRGFPALSMGRGRGGYQGPLSRHSKGDSLDAMLDDVLNSNRR